MSNVRVFRPPGDESPAQHGEAALAVPVANHHGVLALGEVVAWAKVQGRTRAAEAQEGMHFAPREALCESTAHASETTGDDRAGTSASTRVGTLIATRIVMDDGRTRPPGTPAVPVRSCPYNSRDCDMNKSDIVSRVAAQSSLSTAAADSMVSAVFTAIGDGLAQDEAVAIAGFGTFSVKKRPARPGRNPRTGEPITIAASSVPSFKASKALRDAMR